MRNPNPVKRSNDWQGRDLLENGPEVVLQPPARTWAKSRRPKHTWLQKTRLPVCFERRSCLASAPSSHVGSRVENGVRGQAWADALGKRALGECPGLAAARHLYHESPTMCDQTHPRAPKPNAHNRVAVPRALHTYVRACMHCSAYKTCMSCIRTYVHAHTHTCLHARIHD